MITTIIPIKIPEKLTSNVQIKNFSNNNWNLVYNDDHYIFDKKNIDKNTKLLQNVENHIIWAANNDSCLPPPNWLLALLKEFTDILINDLLLYGPMSIIC